jgi:DNA polymerase-4
MNSSAYAGHRKIVHVGIDTFAASRDQTTKPLAQTAHRAGLLSLLCEYTDLVEFTAADAVCLDVTYNTFDIPFGARVAKMIKGDIKRQLGLGVSVGLGPTKFLAKLAMASARPDGLTVVLPEQVGEFLVDQPIDQLPGVGEITRQRLAAMGIERIGQLARLPQDDLVRRFGQRGNQLWLLAQGRDDDPVAPAERPGQISEQIAFDAPIYGREEMHDALRELATALSGRLRRRALRGRLVVIEVHYPDFSTTTRTLRLPDFTDRSQALLETAIELLRHTEAHPTGVRQLGIGLGGFAGEAVEQLDLFA